MRLINLCGGQGVDELVANVTLSKAILPDGYFPQLQKYFSVLDGHIYMFNEDRSEYLSYMDLDKVYFDIVWLKELKAELKSVSEGVAAL